MKSTVLGVILSAALCAGAWGQSARELNDSGIDAYAMEKYGIALEKFGAAKEKAQEEKAPVLDYNLGATLARDGEFEKASQAFDRAAQKGDKKLASRAKQAASSMHYDQALANALESEETGSPSKHDAAMEHVQKALAAAREALLADPGDDAARINYELSKRLLERLRKNEEQEQQQQEEEQEQEQEQQEKDQQEPQDQGDEDEQDDGQPSDQPDQQDQDSQNQNQDQQEPEQSEQEQKEPHEEDGSQQEQQAQEQPQEGSPREPAESNATLNVLDTIEENDEEALKEMLKGRYGAVPNPEKDW